APVRRLVASAAPRARLRYSSRRDSASLPAPRSRRRARPSCRPRRRPERAERRRSRRRRFRRPSSSRGKAIPAPAAVVSARGCRALHLRMLVRAIGPCGSIHSGEGAQMRGTTLAVTAGLAVILLTGTAGAGASESLLVPATSLLAADVRSLPGDSSADIYGVGGGKVDTVIPPQHLKFNLSAHEGPDGDFGH